jgi:hypothetical protein
MKMYDKVLFVNIVLAALMSGSKYDVIPHNGRLFKRKQSACFGFPKQSPLSRRNAVTELNTKELHLQIMLPEVG